MAYIQAKYNALIITAISAVLLTFGALSMRMIYSKSLKYRIESYQTRMDTLNDLIINKHMIEMERVLDELSGDPRLHLVESDPSVQEQIIEEWDYTRSLFPYQAWIYYGYGENEIFTSPYWEKDEDYNLRNRPWYSRGSKTDKLIWIDPFVEYVTSDTVLTAVKSIYRDDGTLAGVLGVDIFLNNLLALYKKTISSLPELILIVDSENNVLYSEVEGLTRYEGTGSTGQIRFNNISYYHVETSMSHLQFRLIGLIPSHEIQDELVDLVLSSILMFLAGLAVVTVVSYMLTNSIGRNTEALISYMGSIMARGGKTGICVNGRDEFYKLNLKLNHLINKLYKAGNRSEDRHVQMINNVSESLKVINRELLNLADECDGDTARKVREIENMIPSLQLYIENSRYSAHSRQWSENRTTEMEHLLNCVDKRMESRAWYKNQHIIIFNRLEPETRLSGPEDALCHVLGTLVDNAVKSSPRHSSITISTMNQDCYAAIDVADMGSGLSEDLKAEIFSEGSSAASYDPEQSFKGGLASCVKIMSFLNGELSLIDKEGFGSVIRMRVLKKPLNDLNPNYRETENFDKDPELKEIENLKEVPGLLTRK